MTPHVPLLPLLPPLRSTYPHSELSTFLLAYIVPGLQALPAVLQICCLTTERQMPPGASSLCLYFSSHFSSVALVADCLEYSNVP